MAEELKIEISEEVQAQMDADPDLAAAMREFFACAKQAKAGVDAGQYGSFEEGIEAITGHAPQRVDTDELAEEMDLVVVFREEGFHPVLLPVGTDLAEQARLNPGTLRIEDAEGNVLWPAPDSKAALNG